MIEAFQNFIKKESLITDNDSILLTVSGGIDSMVMLYLFMNSGYHFEVAHCNFGLRGTESDGDEALVNSICTENNISFFSKNFETKEFAAENKVSTQMAARELRYNWFNQLCIEHNLQLIATAHHQNDVAETMLINITRGTGISGLHGILPKKNNIIRPLLFANRNEIEAFAKAENIPFREDSSNKKTDYWRNKIRLEVMPKLASLNEKVIDNFYELSNRIKIDEQLLQEKLNDLKKIYVKNQKGLVYIDLKIKQHYADKTLLFHVLHAFGFTENDIIQLCENTHISTGAIFDSKTHQLLVDRKYFVIKEREVEVINQTIEIGKTTVEVQTNLGSIHFETLSEYPKVFEKNSLYLDKDKTGNEFLLHTWQQGDRFKPLGMQGTKLISDYLIDKKINQFEKEKCLVLTSKT
ncbi:MAG: tRNA lysidine(34) synthetase TilS, partial [Bacteroidia bacterium]|nr:tRNA lysidine(34) synthetase TilS [Bacteroidia bacterium]